MADKLEAFIDERIQEFDTVELPEDLWAGINARMHVKNLRPANNKLLSRLIYFGLSTAVIVITLICFVSKRSDKKLPVASLEKPKGPISKKLTPSSVVLNDQPQVRGLKGHPNASVLNRSVEKREAALPGPIVRHQKDTFQISETGTSIPVEKGTMGADTGFFYHISYNGGPVSNHRNSQVLFWFTEREITAKQHFIIEHFCWGRWINRGRYAGKGRPGTGAYNGKEPGKFQYKFKIPRHSGENVMRVVLMNDSNVRLSVSRELRWEDKFVPGVEFSVKRRAEEIRFSTETYYEMYDDKNEKVKGGWGKVIAYADLLEGVYTLHYDNTTTTFKRK